MTSSDRPLVSVVIAAHNEERYIAECLRSLSRQTYSPIEIIVVDDGSTDETATLASQEGTTLIRQDHVGAGAARNRGAELARGDILVFVDADMVMAPGFVDRLIAPMLEDGAKGTFTKEIRVANTARLWARAHMLGRGLPLRNHFRDDFPDRWENYRAVWRADFEAVGGFEETGHGEDVTLGRKLGVDAHAAPGAECWHYEPDSLVDIFRSARWYGRGDRIRELDRPRARHRPSASLRRGLSLARQHQMPSLLLYRLVWDCGVLVGLSSRERGRHAI
jgi:glycosyltransferase involved in cell wall biosynthesis